MSFGGSSTTSSTKVDYTPEQQAVMSAASPIIQNYTTSGGAKMPTWSKIPGFNGAQTWGQGEALGNAQGQLADLGNLWGDQAKFIASDALNPDSNPYLQSTAQGAVRPIYDNLLQKVLPNIRGEAITNGMYGGTAQGLIQNQAVDEANRTASDTTSRIYSGAYESGMSRLMQSLGLGATIGNSVNVGANEAQKVGATQFGMESAQKEEAFQKYMYEQLAPFLAAREGVSAAMAPGVATSTTQTQNTNPLMQVLGGISMAASFL